MSFLALFLSTFLATCRDVLPIAVIILGFQLAVLRRPIAQWQRVGIGFAAVIVGLTFFLMGLEIALFPLGKEMAQQLTAPTFLVPQNPTREALASLPWYAHFWTYLFAFAIGFSATLAEPALLAVAIKARDVSGGTLRVWPLRIAVALGAGTGVMLGTLRIVLGVPLLYFLLVGYALVVVQTFFAPRAIIPLAYDSGGVTTSTVTVPIVAALGLGLATQIPERNPLTDGFGMIALTVLFPMMTVMGYAQLAQWWNRRSKPSA
jgi:hypothetical protein